MAKKSKKAQSEPRKKLLMTSSKENTSRPIDSGKKSKKKISAKKSKKKIPKIQAPVQRAPKIASKQVKDDTKKYNSNEDLRIHRDLKSIEINQLMKKLKKLNDKDRKLRAIESEEPRSLTRSITRSLTRSFELSRSTESKSTDTVDNLETVPFNELNQRVLNKTKTKLLTRILKSVDSSRSTESEQSIRRPPSILKSGGAKSKPKKIKFKQVEFKELNPTNLVESPLVKSPAVESPSVKSPAVESSSVKSSAVETSSVKSPAESELKRTIGESISSPEMKKQNETIKPEIKLKTVNPLRTAKIKSKSVKSNRLKSFGRRWRRAAAKKKLAKSKLTKTEVVSQPVKLKRGEKSRSERDCRICLQSIEDESNLVHPCACTGSQAYVHKNCLYEWIRIRGLNKCDICHQEYAGLNLIKKYRSFFSWVTSSSLLLSYFSAVIIISFFIFCILYIAYLEFKTSKGLANQSLRILLLFLLTVHALVIALAMAGLISKCWTMFIQWRRDNYTVILPNRTIIQGPPQNSSRTQTTFDQPAIIQMSKQNRIQSINPKTNSLLNRRSPTFIV